MLLGKEGVFGQGNIKQQACHTMGLMSIWMGIMSEEVGTKLILICVTSDEGGAASKEQSFLILQMHGFADSLLILDCIVPAAALGSTLSALGIRERCTWTKEVMPSPGMPSSCRVRHALQDIGSPSSSCTSCGVCELLTTMVLIRAICRC